ncbi:hypothetical protein ChTU502y2012_393g0005 [Cryptosporidium hominis]|nr:hypothetical protein ChTU502y2012_393g0005 [Cryptosporidium hominis]
MGVAEHSSVEKSGSISETPIIHSVTTPETPMTALNQASPISLTPLAPLGVLNPIPQFGVGLSPLNGLSGLSSPLVQHQLQLQNLYNLIYCNKQGHLQSQLIPSSGAGNGNFTNIEEFNHLVSREITNEGHKTKSIDEFSDDSTLVKSSLGSTATITPSKIQESQGSSNISTTPNLGNEPNIFGSCNGNNNNAILSQYIQYLQFIQGQQVLEANKNLILGSLLNQGNSGQPGNDSSLLDKGQQSQTRFPLINFQNSEEKGLKGGGAPANQNSKLKLPSQKLDSKLDSSTTEQCNHSKKRWKWVHFDDSEVQEWTPKFSLCNNSNINRMVTRTGYMLIYKRKDWAPHQPTCNTGITNACTDVDTNMGLVPGMSLGGDLGVKECERNLILKKLSVLNLRKQNVTYLKNVILRPSIDRWREEWTKRLEASKDDDNELVKNYLFGGFLAIPNDWWMCYVHGDDLEKILCHNSGEFIKFWSYENLYCKHSVVEGGKQGKHEEAEGSKFLDPFLFWEGRVKLFPPELLSALAECISKENSLLRDYYSLDDGMCLKCVESLYGILNISLKQSRIIYEIMRTDIANESEVCLTSTRMFNSLIAKFDLKHKNPMQMFQRKQSQLNDKFGIVSKNESSTIDFDYNWRSIFTDIKRDIQRNGNTSEQMLLQLHNASDSHSFQAASIESGLYKSTNRVQDWSKDIALGSAKCPHGSYVRSKVSGKTVILIPLRLLEEFMSLEEQRSRKITSFVLFNKVKKDKEEIIASIYKKYLRYKCSNKLLPCKHCTTP